MMKKSGLAFIALVAVATIYYFTVGSTQIVTKIKEEINREVLVLEKSGFKVEEREVKERREHFVIDFNNTKNITEYLGKSSHNISQTEVALLQGLKVAVDIEYSPTVKDIISFDIYPTKLPTFFYQEIKDDNKSIGAIDKMLKGKLILVHINVDKLLSGFDGYLKDIDTKFDNGDKNGHFLTKGFSFKGDIADEKIKNIHQNIEEMSFVVGKKIKLSLSKLKMFMENPMDARHGDNSSNYTLKSLKIKNEDSKDSLSLIINNMSGSSKDTKKGELIDGIANFNIASIEYGESKEKVLLKNTKADIKIENVNIDALNRLESMLDDNSSFEQMIPLLKNITKSDLSFSISNLSLESITSNGKEMKGLNISAVAKTDKNFDWKGVDVNPMKLMQLGSIKANIALSDELFGLLAQDPKMMMVMMLTQPTDKNGTKVYDLEFDKGSIKVNGKPFM